MKTKLIVWIVGLLAFVAGFLSSSKIGYGPSSAIAVCGMTVFIFVSAAVVRVCEKGKYEVPSYYLFLIACASLVGFVVRWFFS